jgi:hypothetical protein
VFSALQVEFFQSAILCFSHYASVLLIFLKFFSKYFFPTGRGWGVIHLFLPSFEFHNKLQSLSKLPYEPLTIIPREHPHQKLNKKGDRTTGLDTFIDERFQ